MARFVRPSAASAAATTIIPGQVVNVGNYPGVGEDVELVTHCTKTCTNYLVHVSRVTPASIQKLIACLKSEKGPFQVLLSIDHSYAATTLASQIAPEDWVCPTLEKLVVTLFADRDAWVPFACELIKANPQLKTVVVQTSTDPRPRRLKEVCQTIEQTGTVVDVRARGRSSRLLADVALFAHEEAWLTSTTSYLTDWVVLYLTSTLSDKEW